jgi:hypothetical protein
MPTPHDVTPRERPWWRDVPTLATAVGLFVAVVARRHRQAPDAVPAPHTVNPPERPWWRDVPTFAAVAGLFVALVFNTAGVWLQVGQTAQTREDTQLGLLTQLNGLARQAEGQMTDARVAYCRDDVLNARDQAAVMEAAQYYDYLAWLFNAGHIDMPSARRYWAPSMTETYEFAALLQVTIAQKRFPSLHQFTTSTPEAERSSGAGVNC